MTGCVTGCTCDPTCAGCVDVTDNDCLICDLGLEFEPLVDSEYGAVGFCYCPEGTYWTSSTCGNCVSNCLECSDGTTCDVCNSDAGYIKNGSNVCECKTGTV